MKFKKMLATLALSLFFSCCDIQEDWEIDNMELPNIDGDLEDMLEEFINEGKKYNIDVKTNGLRVMKFAKDGERVYGGIKFGEDGMAGLCVTILDYKFIYVGEDYRDSGNRLKIVSFHEFAHCFLGLEHTDEDAPFSIMNPNLPLSSAFEPFLRRKLPELIKKLFTEGV